MPENWELIAGAIGAIGGLGGGLWRFFLPRSEHKALKDDHTKLDERVVCVEQATAQIAVIQNDIGHMGEVLERIDVRGERQLTTLARHSEAIKGLGRAVDDLRGRVDRAV